jgi:FolB domain-containing protein
MDKILISGLIATGIIGVKEPEREFPQELLLDIELEYPLNKAGESD